jgi:hypothetical protein
MESIQKIGEQKKWFQGLMQSIKIDSSSSPRFLLVPIF